MTAKSGNLTPRQKLFVAERASGLRVEDAGKRAGISQRQAYRYSVDPLVVAAIREAQDDMLQLASGTMLFGAQNALSVLCEVMDDPQVAPMVRVRAASEWLSIAFRLHELVSLAERVSALEARASGNEVT
jgi:hypothetical protein